MGVIHRATKAKRQVPTVPARKPRAAQGPRIPDQEIGGSRSAAFNQEIIRQLFGAIWCGGLDLEGDENELRQRGDATLSAAVEIKPQDGLEGIIAAQMVATHNAA